jgi:hypothetical protein
MLLEALIPRARPDAEEAPSGGSDPKLDVANAALDCSAAFCGLYTIKRMTSRSLRDWSHRGVRNVRNRTRPAALPRASPVISTGLSTIRAW